MDAELEQLLLDARRLSQWGPEFGNIKILDAWTKRLAEIPIKYVARALDELSGNKEFPSVNEVRDKAKTYNIGGASISKDKMADALAIKANIFGSPLIQDMRKNDYKLFLKVEDYFTQRSGILFKNPNFERLNQWKEDPWLLIKELERLKNGNDR